MKTVKKVLRYFLFGLLAYLGLGYLLHLVIFPEKIPEVSTYFQPGDVFKSDVEGLTQTVIKQEKGYVWCNLEFAPHAAGPPLHVHFGFDETFEVGEQAISMIVNTDTQVVQPGNTLLGARWRTITVKPERYSGKRPLALSNWRDSHRRASRARDATGWF